MNKHTDGPWEVRHSESKNAWNIIGTRLGSRYKIARCPYEVEPRLSERWNELEKAEQLANATLRAAATDLLEACEAALGMDTEMEGVDSPMPNWLKQQLQAAIAKARGQNE